VVTGNITNGNRYYGIRLNGSSHNVVTHNIANSNRIAGISLTIVSNNTIADNVTDSNGWIGIYSVDSWENIIRDNVARNNKEGMFASGIWIISDLTVSRDNIVTGNTLLNNKNGLLLIKTHGDRVESNLIRKSTESGVVSILTEEISLVDNLVTDNGDPSLPFVPITPVEFSGRLTSDDPTDSWTLFLPKDAVVYAIAETDTLGTLDIQKVVDSSGREIPGRWRGGQLSIKEFRVPQDDNYTFTVTLMHGTPDQVHLCWREEWTDSDYVLKILSANQAEIDLIEVEGHEILANEIHDSAKDGIRLFESENNVLEENSITGNRENGLYLYGSPMNRVWHNNIYDNNRAGGTYYNAFSDQPIELFYNQEGNYWGHTTPPCFWVYGGANMPYDSNRGDVVDSYPYCEESGWAR
jgi:parallel beta-helix repeat protein